VEIRPADLVGRQPELDRLGEALDRLDRGTVACLAIEGEPGIGKSRLLLELRRRAEEKGYLALDGSAAEFERDLPFGVWVDALDDYVAAQDPNGVVADVLGDLATMLPSLRGARGVPAPGDERLRAIRALQTLLERLAAAKPLVLILDDLHWSDAASIDVLAALLRRGGAARILLALGYRTGRAPPRLSSALAAPDVTILELGPLSAAACAELAGERLDAARRTAIYEQSGGNPFYTLELARASQPPPRSPSGDRLAHGTGVPRLVAAVLVDELEGLTADARRLLDAGAIAGDPFEPELGYAIAELSPPAGGAALDELLATRLLRPTDVPRRFAFRHPLVRRAVYEASQGGWRLGAHARAAAALAEHGASPTAQAHHVEESAARGDRAAIALLLEAGDADAARAPASAAHWYAAALRLIPEQDTPARLRTLGGLARAQQSTGDLERCVDTLLTAIDLVGPEGVAIRLRLISACASCEHFLGRHEPATRRLLAALETLPDQWSREAATALVDLSAGAFFTLDIERMCEFARRAVAVARGVDHDALAPAAAMRAHAAAIAGLVGEAREYTDVASAILDGLPDDALAGHLGAINRLAWAEHLIERFGDAIRHGERGAAVARATGQGQFLPLVIGAQALSTASRGDLEAAATLMDEAIEAAALAANDYVSCSVLTTAATIAVPVGDLDAVRRLAERAVACVAAIDGDRMAAMARARLAVTLRELGESEAATRELVSGAGGWDLPLLPPGWRVLHMEALTRADLDNGDLVAATGHADLAAAAAAELGLPLATAIAQRARAAVQLGEGRPEAAAAALASAAGADAVGARVEAARSRVLAARALAVGGDRSGAVELLRPAEHELDECGAVRDRAEARRELRRLGARSEPRGPAGAAGGGLDSLSRREREVAILVTERKTNKEVARELFLSEKTVESHLRNIFAKLGASSRVDVARAVERSQD
jgi:DNA-binding NarL/FixJ family response regulator